MADGDKLNGLTRRRILGGMATIGVAAGAGGATWARLQDSERKEFTVTAGTIDLLIDGQNSPNAEGQVIQVDIGPVSNDECYDHKETLTNAGNIPATFGEFTVQNLQGSENEIIEPERDNGDDTPNEGELAEHLTLTTILIDPDTGNRKVLYEDVPLKKIVGNRVFCNFGFTGGTFAPGEDLILKNVICVEDENISDAMTDQVTFDLEVTIFDERTPR